LSSFANGPGISGEVLGDDTFDHMWNQRMDSNDISSEYFADLFLGWTYNTHGAKIDPVGLKIFNVNMVEWVKNPGK